MNSTTLDSKNLKLEILPEGQELVKDILQLSSKDEEGNVDPSNNDLAIIVGDALMYYKILLEHKLKGGQVILKMEDQEVKLPVISSVN